MAIDSAPNTRAEDAVGVDAIADAYRERVTRFSAERDSLAGRWDRLANLRLLVFVLALVLLVWGMATRAPVLLVLGAVAFTGFIVLARRHGQVRRRRARIVALVGLNQEGIARLARNWGALPLRHTRRPDPLHPYALDLDIFGRASLLHLLERDATALGRDTLARWLLAPAPPDVIGVRQEAVRELAANAELRQNLEAIARLGGAYPDPEPLLAWAEGEPWLLSAPRLLWAARASVALTWLFIALQVAGVVPVPLWLAFVGANLVLWRALGGRAYEGLTRVREQEEALLAYADLLATVAGERFSAPLLTWLRDTIAGENGHAAAPEIARLRRLASLLIPRGAMLYVPIQLLTLWEIHAYAALERWQLTSGGRARAWLDALADVEALAALAGLAIDNPEWAFPEVSPSARAFEAHGLGHPLIRDRVRVANDVTIGPAGTFLLVTGSNMSGKSTLLRAVGVNAVLAGTGGPVCASALTMPPVALWSAMRVQDSLEQGVSYFMAELQRLKQVVDAADAGGDVQLYLLDEILHGTNSTERRIAARRIILHLVRRGAIGAVSTHDLALADDPALAASAQPIHFTEQITRGRDGAHMSFDYRARPGIATSTNALALMEIVGIDVSE